MQMSRAYQNGVPGIRHLPILVLRQILAPLASRLLHVQARLVQPLVPSAATTTGEGSDAVVDAELFPASEGYEAHAALCLLPAGRK